MFFYLSFLRPPPLQSATYGTILITPQIANDLRTEPFDGSEDIFYAWSQFSGYSSSTRESTTKPMKLTTWRQSSAYKEIPVPLPPGVRDGQSWRLLLGGARTQGSDFTAIDLHDHALGRSPFPVISMPIQFGPRVLKKGTKQEQIERVYRLWPARGDEIPEISLRLTEQTSFDLDKKIWDSGVGLSSWLVGLEENSVQTPGVEELKAVLFSSEPRNVLELGAGIGIVGLTLAALRSSKQTSEQDTVDRIIMTDLESAMPLLEQNMSTNKHHFLKLELEAAVLDWDNESLPDYIQEFPDGFDAIIMADVTYNTASFPSLVRTLSQLIRIGKKPPLVLMGYKERHVEERTLWDLAQKVGVGFQRIGEKAGAGGAPVEVWLGQVQTR
ncbi:hypothetical protein Hypma_003674 [Hypsizygus marmoreus]|uniref:Methyltransferase-domain-containing protein n=1 Tax=Hypsizygus marmoreus TaxID=39966 RepID=A0A369J8T6_HYPMA|nr:hypothetical protein Hypma_003674 [Hypsizygus marmoreus]